MLEKARARRSGGRGVALMGVCNITPDSFSDGGRHFTEKDAIARIDTLIAEGADIVDIGGESTRPGAEPVEAHEQIRRVLPAVRHAIACGACVSIDTTDVRVATACLEAGAQIVNDVSCLRDPSLARVAKDAGAAFVLMHSRGTPADMQTKTTYDGDLLSTVVGEWRFAAERANAQGLSRQALVMDPGIGFAKTAEQSTELLARTRDLVGALAPVPVLIGASRKSFLKSFDKDATAEERVGGSVAAAIFAARAGAAMLRVHDVRATAQAIDVFERLEGGT
jgi:dihydropteroate synthase